MERELEKKLVEEARVNPEAFGKLFEAYYPAIYRYCLHRTGNAEVASDVAAETFFKALNKLKSFRWAGVPFSAWLYRIAGNETIDYFRKAKYAPASYDAAGHEFAPPDPAAEQDIEKELIEAQDIIDNHAKYMQVKTALLTLPEKYQEVLALRFLEDKKILEICSILGKNEGTVKSLLSRGLSKLREYFAKNEMQPSLSSGVMNGEGKDTKGGNYHG